MRLIGGHDYYDSALGMGRDPDLVFVRNKGVEIPTHAAEQAGIKQRVLPGLDLEETRKGDRLERRESDIWGSFRARVEVRLGHVAAVVCGVLYHGVAAQVWHHHEHPFHTSEDTLWSREQLARFLDDNGVRIARERKGFAFLEDDRPADLAAYFAPARLDGAALELVIEHQAAIMIRTAPPKIRNTDSIPWEVNRDKLGDLGFYRVMDPYTMFQELGMFVGGVLPRSGNEMVELDDKTRKQKHGFDEKSFRKPPQT